ncbi:MAG TPA: hypothetical protein VGH74_07000 [Planctomycetaceae bacterium]
MLIPRFRSLTFSGALLVAGSLNTAWGQCCVPLNPACCPPIRVTACYKTVPVTEIRECRRTVQRPIVETKYVEQPVTEYRQVVENKTAEIPTCSYQNVTEMRTVQRDCGHWESHCYQRPQITPCQYDSRPDLFGLINRTGFSLRMAFTPQSWTEKVYVPNVVCQQVPVTRQVAVRGTQTVNYQVAKMVPVCTTRKVAVNTVRMVCEEIVTKHPVTVFKTVPMDSSLALGVPATAPTATTALQPTNDSTPIAIKPKNSGLSTAPERTAKNVPSDLNDDEGDAFERNDNKSGGSKRKEINSIRVPSTNGNMMPASGAAADEEEVVQAERPIGRWVARKKPKSKAADGVLEGPAFPEMAQARVRRAKK